MARPVAHPPYSTSRATVSGRSAAHCAATGAPSDQPKRSKDVAPIASVTARIVASSSAMVRGPSYGSESPLPGRS